MLLESPEQIRKVLLQAVKGDTGLLQDIIEGKRRITNSCGSGMTAAVIWLALHELGVSSSIYDESWMGYASRSQSDIVKGE